MICQNHTMKHFYRRSMGQFVFGECYWCEMRREIGAREMGKSASLQLWSSLFPQMGFCCVFGRKYLGKKEAREGMGKNGRGKREFFVCTIFSSSDLRLFISVTGNDLRQVAKFFRSEFLWQFVVFVLWKYIWVKNACLRRRFVVVWITGTCFLQKYVSFLRIPIWSTEPSHLTRTW